MIYDTDIKEIVAFINAAELYENDNVTEKCISSMTEKTGEAFLDERAEKLSMLRDDEEIRSALKKLSSICNDLCTKCDECPVSKYCNHFIMDARKKVDKSSFTMVDLFCGAGGLSLGFTQEGFVTRLANDIQECCVDTYAHNHPETPRNRIILGDIKEVADNLADTIKNTNTKYYPHITEGGRYFYILESDTNTYVCHVAYPTNPECGYWFDASGKPHTPRAELEYRWEPKNCQNGFRWWNRNHVVLTNQITGEEEHRYDKQLEIGYLFMEDGSEQAIGYKDEGEYVTMPAEGGKVRYGVWTGVYVKGQLYADTAWYEWTIPAIGAQETHLFDTICRGESIVFPSESRNIPTM